MQVRDWQIYSRFSPKSSRNKFYFTADWSVYIYSIATVGSLNLQKGILFYKIVTCML